MHMLLQPRWLFDVYVRIRQSICMAFLMLLDQFGDKRLQAPAISGMHKNRSVFALSCPLSYRVLFDKACP
jgi:hypothetical protein